MTCGIYCIENTVNQKKYIGLSTDIERRLKEHLRDLRNKNTKRENDHFIRSFHKYGEDAFQARIILVCDEDILAPMEEYLIKIFKTYDPKIGYNKTFGGERNKATTETRKKLSESLKGRKHSEEARKKISESLKGKYTKENHPMFGKHHSEESKKKISESLKGKYTGENNPFFGRRHTEEAKRKMSELRKGKYTGENSPNYNHDVPNGSKLLKEKERGVKIKDLAVKYNCSRRTIRNRINKVL